MTFSAPELELSSRRLRVAVAGVILFSLLLNLLGLTGTFYLLSVHDGIVSGEKPGGLGALSLLAAGLFCAFCLLDIIRGRLVSRLGRAVASRLVIAGGFPAMMRDGEQATTFFSSPAAAASFDTLWLPIYVVAAFLLHPSFGFLAVAVLLLAVGLACACELAVRKPRRALTAVSSEMQGVRSVLAGSGVDMERSADAAAHDAWFSSWRLREAASRQEVSDRVQLYQSLARTLHLAAQSIVFGVGAYLGLLGSPLVGVAFAASILVARMLGPLVCLVGQLGSALDAFRLLIRVTTDISPPVTSCVRRFYARQTQPGFSVEAITALAPDRRHMVLRDISFALSPRDGLGIIGPTGSGKSALLKVLAGGWPTEMMLGTVRLGCAAPRAWNSGDQFGDQKRLVGYLPQRLAFLPGTVAEVISGFDVTHASEEVLAAAASAGLHGFVSDLPHGYDTRLEDSRLGLPVAGGEPRSDAHSLVLPLAYWPAGYVQALGLARALYRDPLLVLLDDPRAFLDSALDAQFSRAIQAVRARGGIVVVATQRVAALQDVDQVLVLSHGCRVAWGAKDDLVASSLQRDSGVLDKSASLSKLSVQSGSVRSR